MNTNKIINTAVAAVIIQAIDEWWKINGETLYLPCVEVESMIEHFRNNPTCTESDYYEILKKAVDKSYGDNNDSYKSHYPTFNELPEIKRQCYKLAHEMIKVLLA